MSNKKTHLADFEICAFRVYLRNHLSYKKVIYIYLSEELSNPVTKSADICKNAVLPKKFKLLEKLFREGNLFVAQGVPEIYAKNTNFKIS